VSGVAALGGAEVSVSRAVPPRLLCLYGEHLVALHGFIKKTRRAPDEDLALARKRQKELEE